MNAPWQAIVDDVDPTVYPHGSKSAPLLDLGSGAALNVFEVTSEEIVGDQAKQGGRGAIDHFGIAVESLAALEEVKQRLVEVGADIGEIQNLGDEWSLFFRDVDGMELEVCALGGAR